MGTPRPFTLVAELTYGCPLRCPYCSNPVDVASPGRRGELSTAEWARVFGEARALGVVQVALTGGEPLLRRDLDAIVAAARQQGAYSTLVTSAVGLTRDRAERLREAGLDHVQISVQDADPQASDDMAGTRSFAQKLEAARLVKELGFPLTLNVVLHRQNLDRIEEILRLSEELAADRVELAKYAVVRLGGPEPTRTHAHALAARRRRADGHRGARPCRNKAQPRLRAIGLVRGVPEAVYGGLGTGRDGRHSLRSGPTVTSRRYHPQSRSAQHPRLSAC